MYPRQYKKLGFSISFCNSLTCEPQVFLKLRIFGNYGNQLLKHDIDNQLLKYDIDYLNQVTNYNKRYFLSYSTTVIGISRHFVRLLNYGNKYFSSFFSLTQLRYRVFLRLLNIVFMDVSHLQRQFEHLKRQFDNLKTDRDNKLKKKVVGPHNKNSKDKNQIINFP